MWWSFLSPFRSGRSESASLGNAGGLFGTSVKEQREMKPGPGVEGSLWPCEYALVREMPETAAEVALFGHLLTVTSVNRVIIKSALLVYYFGVRELV